MFRVALRGALSRKLRLALTATAVAIGVAFVSGAYVLTDTMMYAFTSLFSQTGAKVDAYVQSPSHYQDQANSFMAADKAPLPEGLVDTVRWAPGVAAAAGEVGGYAQIVDKNGKAVAGKGGAPSLGVSAPAEPSLSSVTMREGRMPETLDETAIDKQTAQTNGFRIGDRVTILTQQLSRPYTLVGTFGFGDVDSMAGATVAAFDLRTAQSILGKAGVYDDIAVKAQPGWTQEQLRDSVAATVGGSWEVVTGQTQSDRTMDAVRKGLGFFSSAMMAFAWIAVFVGSFIIFNTFSILIVQRTREFGLLRALGAQIRQIVLAVVVEAILVGALASVIGLALGVGVAAGLTQAMRAIGIDLPPAPMQYEPRTFLVGIAVGVGVTLVAAIGPALRTRRLSPIAALTTGLVGSKQGNVRRRLTIGVPALLFGLGLAILSATGRTGHGVIYFIVGGLLIFLGVTSLSAFVIRPLAAAVGWPFARLFHLPARLGLRNAERSPARTARTAAALMIGVGLISFVTVLGSSMKASASSAIDDLLTADYILMPSSANQGFSPGAAQAVRAIPGVQSVAEMHVGYFERDGVLEGVGGMDPKALNTIGKVDVLSGNLDSLTNGGVAIGKSVADALGLSVGQTLNMNFDRTGLQRIPVVAIYDDAQGSIGKYMLGPTTFAANFTTQLDYMAAVRLAGDADTTAVTTGLNEVQTAYPNVKIQDHAQFKADALAQIDQLLSLVYTLLALAVLIAILGIVNTLALSTLERVRELGLLRAVGMGRGELRAMVRYEAVIVAVIGGLLGLLVGLAFAAIALMGMRDSGMGVSSYPVVTLAIFVVASAVAGVLAAILPARRAAKVDIVQAVATQ